MNTSNRKLRLTALSLAALALVLALAALILALRANLPRGGAAADPSLQADAAAGTNPKSDPQKPKGSETQELLPTDAAANHAEDVQDVLDSFVAAQGGVWDIYYESLSDGSYAAAQSGHGAEPRSISASVIKLFVMGAVYDAVEQGTLSHDSVYPNLRLMITVSDNDACNTLVLQLGGGDRDAGIRAVNRFAQSIGCNDTEMTRLMREETGTENYVTARDCATILRLIYTDACVSPDASLEMRTLLLGQTRNNRLPANLPSGTAVAHKTGELPNLSCCDVGIIYSPGGDYILCVLNNHSQNDGQTISSIATLSRTVYDIVTA